MRYEKNRKIAGIDEYKLQKVGKMLIIPGIILILIIVILILDRKPKDGSAADTAVGQTAASSGAEAAQQDRKAEVIEVPGDTAGDGTASETAGTEEGETDASAGEETAGTEAFAGHGIEKGAPQEIQELVLKYQRARTTGDPELMCQVFGNDPSAVTEELRTTMAQEAEAYESFENTQLYTAGGVNDTDTIVFISSDMKFSGIDTPAPMMIWAYIVRDAGGNVIMLEPDSLDAAQTEAVDRISASEDVRVLYNDIQKRLGDAVVSDNKLALLYTSLTNEGE